MLWKKKLDSKKDLLYKFFLSLFFLFLFSLSMAYVESSVVVYLRRIFYPEGFHFPLKIMTGKIVLIEIGREVATLLMLFSLSFLLGRDLKERIAYFFLAFGFWDIFYYFWLKVFLNWPSSLFTLDVLFLIPVPWVGPVIAPVLVSLFFIASSFFVLYLRAQGKDFAFSYPELLGLLLGGILIFSSFIWGFKHVLRREIPPFPWSLFLIGFLTLILSFCWGLRGRIRE
jgi:hypothetical protein